MSYLMKCEDTGRAGRINVAFECFVDGIMVRLQWRSVRGTVLVAMTQTHDDAETSTVYFHAHTKLGELIRWNREHERQGTTAGLKKAGIVGSSADVSYCRMP